MQTARVLHGYRTPVANAPSSTPASKAADIARLCRRTTHWGPDRPLARAALPPDEHGGVGAGGPPAAHGRAGGLVAVRRHRMARGSAAARSLLSRPGGDWCFLCGTGHPEDEAFYRVVGIGHPVGDDPTLEARGDGRSLVGCAMTGGRPGASGQSQKTDSCPRSSSGMRRATG